MVKEHSDSMGYSFWLAARVLLYASSHRQDDTYHSLCYTSRGSLAGTRNSSMGPPHEGSIRRPIAPWANALTTELHLAPWFRQISTYIYKSKLGKDYDFTDTPKRDIFLSAVRTDSMPLSEDDQSIPPHSECLVFESLHLLPDKETSGSGCFNLTVTIRIGNIVKNPDINWWGLISYWLHVSWELRSTGLFCALPDFETSWMGLIQCHLTTNNPSIIWYLLNSLLVYCSNKSSIQSINFFYNTSVKISLYQHALFDIVW